MAEKKWDAGFDSFEAEDIRLYYDSTCLRWWHLGGEDRVYRIVGIKRHFFTADGKTKHRAALFLETRLGDPVDVPLIVNPTNREIIISLYGEKKKGWMGKLLKLYPTTTQSPRGEVPCIRVRPKAPREMTEAEIAERVAQHQQKQAERRQREGGERPQAEPKRWKRRDTGEPAAALPTPREPFDPFAGADRSALLELDTSGGHISDAPPSEAFESHRVTP